MKNVLVIAAHPDDELLGSGATIRKLVDHGIVARALILGEGLTSRKNARSQTEKSDLLELKRDTLSAADIIGYSSVDFCDYPDNRLDSVDLLDIIKSVSLYVDKYSPDTIFTHHHGDLNIDHRRTFDAVITACRPVGSYCVQNIYTFETPSSTEWNFTYGHTHFEPNVFSDVSKYIEYKIKAMACYRSESAAFPHPRSSEALKALARYRGSISSYDYAEAFHLVRGIL